MSKLVSYHTKNILLYINLALCLLGNHWWIWTCTWGVFISHVASLDKTSSNWCKYSESFLAKKFVVCTKSPMGLNFIFSNGKDIFLNSLISSWIWNHEVSHSLC